MFGWWLGSFVAGEAQAAECATAYSVDQMLNDLVAVETFLRNADNSNAGQAAVNLEAGLACMDSVLPRMISGRALRAVGAGLVAGGETDKGEDWLRTAGELEPSFEFGIEDLPEVHVVRDVYNTVRASAGEAMPVQGATLTTSGVVWLDGRKILEPKARLDAWHLVQLDTAGQVRSWLIEGNRFPEAVLAMAAPVDTEGKKPKGPKNPEGGPEPVASVKPPKPDEPRAAKMPKPNRGENVALNTEVVGRKRPWEKTPLMIGGGAIGGVAAAVYGLHLQQLSKFNNLNAAAPLEKQWSKTNQLYVASLAILAVGTGTFTWGVIIDGATPTPAVRIRF